METKKVYKRFSVVEQEKEENFLRKMHNEGWKFVKVKSLGWYYFEKCEPKDVVYRLDFNQDRNKNMDEYVQMFKDCGWDYIMDFWGYSYFCKPAEEDEGADEIFCDDESKFDLMVRVFKGKMIPLIMIFLMVILPQLYLSSDHDGLGPGIMVFDVVVILFVILGLLYLVIFSVFAVKFYQFDKNLHKDKASLGYKYGLIAAGILLGAVGIGLVTFSSFASDYTVEEKANGFTMNCERLNETYVKEYDLKKGDEIRVEQRADDGNWYISIGMEDEEPVFYGNTFMEFEDFTVKLPKNGKYQIVCRGKKGKGTVDFTIK